MGDEIPELDLLGEPYREPADPRGRPKHRVTREKRKDVSALRAAGLSRDDIALVLGVSKPTLAKYYFAELNEGVAQERARALLWLRASAEGGNVSAQKAWIRVLADGQGAPAVPREIDPDLELGKKEKALRDAKAADQGSAWGELVRH
ncbi:hypothetical protein [uncultured Zoogloea sp.]|uniref:hypothetical protein n=1 Tax=uncultured Zoogloea sp. TaxID=160237 RepID=UPI00263399E4|nr:hypothetical protein [uncultured Zoogloea sp.]